jgi:hypothetical protein
LAMLAQLQRVLVMGVPVAIAEGCQYKLFIRLAYWRPFDCRPVGKRLNSPA